MSASTHPEDWWSLDEVQRLLTNILDHPNNDYSESVVELLRDAGGVLLETHVHGFARALDKFVGKKKHFANISRPVALHTWLLHFAGTAHKLLAVPVSSCGSAGAPSRNMEKAVAVASEKLFSKRAKLKQSIAKGCPTARNDLALLRTRPFDFRLLQETSPPDQKKVAAAPPVDPPPVDPTKAELRRRASCCLTIAMGTHGRLGAVSGLRLLVGDHDLLRQIARDAELRTSDWLPRPPPKEVPTLRRHIMIEHAEHDVTRGLLDEQSVLSRSLMRENEHLRRQLVSAERRIAEEQRRSQEIREAAAAWKQMVTAELEQQHTQERRESMRRASAS
jgi:hypothetical protein